MNLFKKSQYEKLIKNPPLICDKSRLALLWTPKAGCTSMVKWFFHHMDLLEEAKRYHPFVHRYRLQCFQKNQIQRRLVQKFSRNSSDYTVIKAVRNPLSRVVSSFIHCLKHKILHKEMQSFLNQSDAVDLKYTFREFVSYLATIDIHSCDPHLKSQVHFLERKRRVHVDYLFPLEMSEEWLGLLEKTLGFEKQYDMSLLSRSPHHTTRSKEKMFVGDVPYNDSLDCVFPAYECFFDDEIKRIVLAIYSEDVNRYGHFYKDL